MILCGSRPAWVRRPRPCLFGLWTAEQKNAAQAVIAQIAGILILIMPRLLNYIVAIYLIIIGLVGLFPNIAG